MKVDEKGFALLLPIVLVVLVMAVGAAIYARQLTDKSTNAVAATKTRILIESEPAGITIQGSPDCDGTKLRKLTPFTCVKADSGLDTTLTAPATVDVQDRSYAFKAWQGCSASSPDQKICRVTVGKGQTKQLKATYSLGNAASTKPSGGGSPSTGGIGNPSPNPSPVPVPSPAGRDIDNQCAKTLSVDYSRSTATCTLNKIVDGQSVEFGMDWMGASPATEPHITATCSTGPGATSCTLYHGTQSIPMAPGTPTVVNDGYTMGGPYPGPNPARVSMDTKVATFGAYSAITLSFPYTFSADGKNFRLSGFSESNNAPKRPPVNYYVNWKYQAM